MGVKGLHSFVEERCPNVKRWVSIPQMAHEHQRRYNVQPELVIDGMALLRKLYCGKLEWIYGGQWVQYIEILKNFVAKFENCGIKLVFFFDGHVCPAKRREWAERRVKKCNEIASLFRWLKNLKRTPGRGERFQLPAAMGSMTSIALKCLCPSVDVYSSVGDGDIEIASYARHNVAAFAVLSNDTDFIIFDTKPYLTIPDLDVHTLETALIDRECFADLLSLPVRKLPLLSCLLGNDFVPKDALNEFHSRLENTCPGRDYTLGLPVLVSRFIKEQRWDGSYQNLDELIHISGVICGNDSLVELLRQGIAMYADLQQLSQPSSPAEWRHVNCFNVSSLYCIFNDNVYGSSELMEDPLDGSLPPAALVYRPLRRRTYSLLLKAQMNRNYGRKHPDDDVAVDEWLAYHGNDLQSPDRVTPLPIHLPDGYVPDLAELWNQGPPRLRLHCYMACLQLPLSEDQFSHMDPQYSTFCCIMNYLLNYQAPPLLASWEVMAFVAQAVSLRIKNASYINNIRISHVETRAVHLASLFMRGVVTVLMLLGATGYPFSLEIALPWNYFDGKLFHEKYIQAKRGFSIEQLCEYQVSSIELFNRLFFLSTYGVSFDR